MATGPHLLDLCGDLVQREGLSSEAAQQARETDGKGLLFEVPDQSEFLLRLALGNQSSDLVEAKL
jgi:hypothetical protein